ncbi:MAG TPA: hypothetical protein VF342_16550 [Alphaproteobacteria bacterium]
MTQLGFSLFTGGPAEAATVAVDGRTEIVRGPGFTFGAEAGETRTVSFTQIEFPGTTVRSFPFEDRGVATLQLVDQRLDDGAGTLFDRDGDGRIESVTLSQELQPEAIQRVDVSVLDGDLLTLADVPEANIMLDDRSAAGAFTILGARGGNVATGGGADAVTVATADDGTGQFTLQTAAGDDTAVLDSGPFFQGSALASLGAGNDTLQVAGPSGFAPPIQIFDRPAAVAAADATAAGTSAADAATGAGTDAAGVAGGTAPGSTGTADASTSIFPSPLGTSGRLDVIAEGGGGVDRFVMVDVDATLAGGPDADTIDVGAGSFTTVDPGPGADTVILRPGAIATVTTARGETGKTPDDADTLRFEGVSPGSAMVRLDGFPAGTTARVEVEASGEDAQPGVIEGRLVISGPGDADPDIINLVGVDSGPLDSLTVIFG